MTLTVTNVVDNPSLPLSAADTYLPDQLIADPKNIVTLNATIVSGAAKFNRGTVLGQITASGKYTIAKAAAGDGSQTPVAILVDNADPTGGDCNAGIYVMGEFNQGALIIDGSLTLAAVVTALQAKAIFAKTRVSAADPS